MSRRGMQRHSCRNGFALSCEWVAAGVLCCISLHAYGQASAPTAERIVIESGWGGLNPAMPFRTHVVIEKDESIYRLTGWHSKSRFGKPLPEQAFPSQTIAPAQVAQLVDAMDAPAQVRIDLRTLEPAVDEAQQKIDDGLKETKLPISSRGLGAQVLAWRDSLRNPSVLAEVLTKGFDATHSDDYPNIEIEVNLSNGTTLRARSGSQQYLMLPWTNAQGGRTYSAAIPHALDALLPKEATNKERLENTLDGTDLNELLGFGLSDQIGRFQAEAEAPEAVRTLDANFKVASVSFINWEGRHLEAEVQLPDGPSNLRLSTRLQLKGKTLANKSDILRIRQKLQLVRSSSALDAHMKSAPNVDFHIHDNFGWTWLNQQTAAQFVDQMQQMKKLPELRSQPALLHGAVMVEEGKLPIYWIVLADRRAVVWKQATSHPEKSIAGSCTSIPIADEDPTGVYDLCLGRVYGADGREE